jgi:hypothetical protein
VPTLLAKRFSSFSSHSTQHVAKIAMARHHFLRREFLLKEICGFCVKVE